MKRHNLLKIAAIFLLGGLFSTGAAAQGTKKMTREETVIIKKEKEGGKTIVEVKDGSVYVNGEAVVTINDGDGTRVYKKIIIEDGDAGDDDKPRLRSFGGGGFNGFGDGGNRTEDMPATTPSRRAMLGVMTDPKSVKVGALVKGITPGSPAEEGRPSGR